MARAFRHRREQRRRRPHLPPAPGHEPRRRGGRAATRGNALQHVAVPHLLRHPETPSAPRPSQRPLRPPLSRAARRHLRRAKPRRRLLALPPRPDRSPTPRMAPPGCEAFYVLAPVPHLGKAPIDWRVEGPRYADRILDYLERRYVPNLREDLVTRRIFTPLDFERSLTPIMAPPSPWSPCSRRAPFFASTIATTASAAYTSSGAGTHPGAGVPGVVSSAKATAGLMLVRPRGRRPPEPPAWSPGRREPARHPARVESFALAARLFDPPTRAAAILLYAWCRHCDDQIDEQHLGFRTGLPRALDRGPLAALHRDPPRPSAGDAVGTRSSPLSRGRPRSRDPRSAIRSSCSRASHGRRGAAPRHPRRPAPVLLPRGGRVGLMMAHIMGARRRHRSIGAAGPRDRPPDDQHRPGRRGRRRGRPGLPARGLAPRGGRPRRRAHRARAPVGRPFRRRAPAP